jgi:hypothetical protein
MKHCEIPSPIEIASSRKRTLGWIDYWTQRTTIFAPSQAMSSTPTDEASTTPGGEPASTPGD